MPPPTQPHPRNGSNNSGPLCMSGFLNKNFLYGTWIRDGGDALAWKWNKSANTLETILLSTVASNELELPIYDLTDDHYALPCGVDDLDNMFIIGNHHDNNSSPTKRHFLRHNPANGAFTNAASWSVQSSSHYDGLDDVSGAGSGQYTYHLFERLTNGTLLHFLSQSDTLGDARGRDWLAFKRVAGTWSTLVGDGHFATTINDGVAGFAGAADRVYITGLYVEPNGGGAGVDRIHTYGIWRTDNVEASSQQLPFYLYADSNALTVWKYKANGGDGTQTMPITWTDKANAQISSCPVTSHSARMGVYVDPATGFPAVIVRDQGTSDYVRLSWTGTTWDTTAATAQGGEHRDVLFEGVRWRRINTITPATNRLALTRHGAAPAHVIQIGDGIRTGESYSGSHDPVWLREQGVYAVAVGDGTTPKVFTVGENSR